MMDGNFQTLETLLREWDGRRRQVDLLRWLPRGLLAGLYVGLAAALISRRQPLLTRDELVILGLASILIGVSGIGLIILLRRRSLAAQARFADRQFGLRERMTAAVEIQSGLLPVDGDITARQLADAIANAKTVDAKHLLPTRVRPVDWLPALAVALTLGIALWLPNPQEAVLLEQRAVTAAIEQQVEELTALSEEIKANDAITPEQVEALLRPIEEALAALSEPGLSREEAVAALSQAEQEMQALSQELATPDLNEALAEAAAALQDQAAAIGLADALQSGQLDQAGAAAGALAGEVSELPAEERAELAERLAEAAAGLRETDNELANSLERAAGALAAGNVEAAQEALAEVSTQLVERGETAAAAGQASSAAGQLGSARGEIAQGSAGDESGESGEGGSGEGQPGSGEAGSPATSGGQEGTVGGPSQGGGHVESVFVPRRTNLEGEGESLELEVQCLADPESCGPLAGQSPSDPTGQAAGGSLVPYDQVFGDYRDAAFEALSAGDIPLGLQDLIRNYFTALEP